MSLSSNNHDLDTGISGSWNETGRSPDTAESGTYGTDSAFNGRPCFAPCLLWDPTPSVLSSQDTMARIKQTSRTSSGTRTAISVPTADVESAKFPVCLIILPGACGYGDRKRAE
uniref:Uncharacterized protein n=1 Tax=Chenopodium quinoa TaxID=63459 RepID=A0A803KQJ3_CHEQI